MLLLLVGRLASSSGKYTSPIPRWDVSHPPTIAARACQGWLRNPDTTDKCRASRQGACDGGDELLGWREETLTFVSTSGRLTGQTSAGRTSVRRTSLGGDPQRGEPRPGEPQRGDPHRD